jgi:hypothetical protein
LWTKSSKKTLEPWAVGNRGANAQGPMDQKFFASFFKKEALPSSNP